MIVDTHVHPISGDRSRYPLSAGRVFDDWASEGHPTAEECLEQMALAGVDQMVLVSSYVAYENDNRYAADCAARYPDRFVASCRVDPFNPSAPAVLSYWIEQRGMGGVRVATAGPRVYPMCERAMQLGIAVEIQAPRAELEDVRRALERFPDLKVILDHLANPPIDDGPPYTQAADFFALAKYPNLHLKLTSPDFIRARAGKSTPAAYLEAMFKHFGAKRLLWGSDFPHTKGSPAAPYKDLVDMARDTLTFLDAADRDQYFGGTAHSLFPGLARR